MRTRFSAKEAGQGFSDTLLAFHLPCSASAQKLSVERKQGKGLAKGFPGGAPPLSLPRSAGEGSLQASPLAEEPLHDKSCMHPSS